MFEKRSVIHVVAPWTIFEDGEGLMLEQEFVTSCRYDFITVYTTSRKATCEALVPADLRLDKSPSPAQEPAQLETCSLIRKVSHAHTQYRVIIEGQGAVCHRVCPFRVPVTLSVQSQLFHE